MSNFRIYQQMALRSLRAVLALFWVMALGQTVQCQNKSQYFSQYRSLADSLSESYKIPACVILSVAFVESGGGTSAVARKLNNHFGIVGKNNPEVSGLKSKYRHFPSIKESFIGFCELVARKKFYPQVKGSDDVKLWLDKIAATGYAANASLWSGHIFNLAKSSCR